MLRSVVAQSVRVAGISGKRNLFESSCAVFAGKFREMSSIPRPQEPAPNFAGKAVVNKAFKDISLKDYNGKWLLLFFYPLDLIHCTFVCPTEIIAFGDRAKEFENLGCSVIACSTDSHFSHLAWINTPRKDGGLGEMKIPVLADTNHAISKAYGVLLEGLGAALRGSFLIDPKGIVRHVTVNDLPVGRDVDEMLRLVKAFQFTDKHGEVCPANWQPDKPTINPADAKKYFEKAN